MMMITKRQRDQSEMLQKVEQKYKCGSYEENIKLRQGSIHFKRSAVKVRGVLSNMTKERKLKEIANTS